MRLTYYGHSAFLLEGDGARVFVDPWLTENPHTAATPADVDDLDAVLVTHGAFDHLGDAAELVERTGADLVCDYATATVLTDRGLPEEYVSGYVWGAVHDGDGWEAKVVEARHLSMFVEERVTAIPLAYVVSIGGERVYHMGDTSIFRDVELFADLYDPTVALIPVGQAEGYFTELHPDEAALVAEWVDADVAVPMHYVPGSLNPAEFEERCRDRGVETDVRRLSADETLVR
ncbi:MAG: metal-dependent hydrolase [Haloferacaceae archaeon]